MRSRRRGARGWRLRSGAGAWALLRGKSASSRQGDGESGKYHPDSVCDGSDSGRVAAHGGGASPRRVGMHPGEPSSPRLRDRVPTREPRRIAPLRFPHFRFPSFRPSSNRARSGIEIWMHLEGPVLRRGGASRRCGGCSGPMHHGRAGCGVADWKSFRGSTLNQSMRRGTASAPASSRPPTGTRADRGMGAGTRRAIQSRPPVLHSWERSMTRPRLRPWAVGALALAAVGACTIAEGREAGRQLNRVRPPPGAPPRRRADGGRTAVAYRRMRRPRARRHPCGSRTDRDRTYRRVDGGGAIRPRPRPPVRDENRCVSARGAAMLQRTCILS